MLDLADAVLTDPDQLPGARAAVIDRLGEAALVDAAGVIGAFQRMNRIADATGIPVDKPLAVLTAGLDEELGIRHFNTAQHTPPLAGLPRLVGRMMRPFARTMMKVLAPKYDVG